MGTHFSYPTTTYSRKKTLPVQYVKGNGKVGPLKKLLNYPKHHGTFRYHFIHYCFKHYYGVLYTDIICMIIQHTSSGFFVS